MSITIFVEIFDLQVNVAKTKFESKIVDQKSSFQVLKNI